LSQEPVSLVPGRLTQTTVVVGKGLHVDICNIFAHAAFDNKGSNDPLNKGHLDLWRTRVRAQQTPALLVGDLNWPPHRVSDALADANFHVIVPNSVFTFSKTGHTATLDYAIAYGGAEALIDGVETLYTQRRRSSAGPGHLTGHPWQGPLQGT
jgi:hypothetical protein